MRGKEVLDVLKKTEAFKIGHFQLSSGLHSENYVQCALALQYPKYAEQLGRALADKYKDKNISCVVGPAMGGIILAHEVARALDVRCLFAERVDGAMKLRRGFNVSKDEKVLVVEDVVTTGGSVLEVVKLLKTYEVSVVGVGSIVDRSSEKIDFGSDYSYLLKLDIVTYNPETCPLCEKGIGIDKPGSRKSTES